MDFAKQHEALKGKQKTKQNKNPLIQVMPGSPELDTNPPLAYITKARKEIDFNANTLYTKLLAAFGLKICMYLKVSERTLNRFKVHSSFFQVNRSKNKRV